MNDLDCIPEPYRSMIQTINGEDIYLIHSIASGEPLRVRRIPADMPIAQAYDTEASFRGGSPGATYQRLKGRDLRTLMLEIARAHGEVIGGAVMANPYPSSPAPYTRSETPLTDAFREWEKRASPEEKQRFVDTWDTKPKSPPEE